jgi:hypothetical protein
MSATPSAASASRDPGDTGGRARISSWRPAAEVMRASMVTVGSMSPDSMRAMVERLQPTRSARARCDSPLSRRTEVTSSSADVDVMVAAYMRPSPRPHRQDPSAELLRFVTVELG